MQDFDLEDETDFLLGGSVNHGPEMEGTYTVRRPRGPGRPRNLGALLCW